MVDPAGGGRPGRRRRRRRPSRESSRSSGRRSGSPARARRCRSARPAAAACRARRRCPRAGRGYEVVRIGRNRRYGHPNLIAFVQRLGAGARRAKLGLLVVGDLSQPRGGPTPSGHRSHQTGLDADIGYAAPGGRAGGPSVAARARATVAARRHRPEDARDDARLEAGGRPSCWRWPPRIRRWIGSSSIPRSRRCCARARDREGAVAGAPAPVVGPPRSLPRAAEMPGRQPAVRAAGDAARRRLRRDAGVVVQRRRDGEAHEEEGGGGGGSRSPRCRRRARCSCRRSASRRTGRPLSPSVTHAAASRGEGDRGRPSPRFVGDEGLRLAPEGGEADEIRRLGG